MLPPDDHQKYGATAFDARDDDHDSVRFEGTDFSGAHAEGHRFIESALVEATLDDVRLDGSRWSECTWERVRGTSVSLPEASLIETRLDGCRLAP